MSGSNEKVPVDQKSPNDDGFLPVFLKLPPEHIVQLKFLLESYEGLGVLRTLNKRTGLVVILGLKDTRQDLESFIEDVSSELQLVRLDPPADWDESSVVDAAAVITED